MELLKLFSLALRRGKVFHAKVQLTDRFKIQWPCLYTLSFKGCHAEVQVVTRLNGNSNYSVCMHCLTCLPRKYIGLSSSSQQYCKKVCGLLEL